MAPDGVVTRWVDRRGGQAALWVIALVITGVAAGYQRRTGPTWPVEVNTAVGGASVSGELPRNHGGAGGALISLLAPERDLGGELLWRRYPTNDSWTVTPLVRLEDRLVAELPHQPPAGKLEYRLRLSRGGQSVDLPGPGPIVIRYKGDVPGLILLPHIMGMFLGMVIGARALLGSVVNEQNPQRHIPWLLAFIAPGGLILGPLVQKFAFGAFWTGWPVGEDLTDTKTLVVVVAWVLAWLASRRFGARRPTMRRAAILAAALVMLAVYFIPHSAHGSQLDWNKSAPTQSQPPR